MSNRARSFEMFLYFIVICYIRNLKNILHLTLDTNWKSIYIHEATWKRLGTMQRLWNTQDVRYQIRTY